MKVYRGENISSMKQLGIEFVGGLSRAVLLE